MKRRIIVLTALVFFVFALALSSTTASAKKKSPSLNKKSISIYVGNKYKLKLKNSSKSAKWTSSIKKIATVSSKGKTVTVKAKKAGKVKITAKIGKKKLYCKVTVKVKKKKVTTPTLGSRTNPRSAYTYYVTDVYDYGTKLGRFGIKLNRYCNGDNANVIAAKNEYNTVPSYGEEYLYFNMTLNYLSGSKQVEAMDVFNFYSCIFNYNGTSNVKELSDWAFGLGETDISDVTMYQGASETFCYVPLIKSGSTPVLYRIQTGYDNKKYEPIYTWFKV